MTSNSKRDAAFDKELKDANRCCESCYNFTLNSRITFERGWDARDAEVAELSAQVDLLSNLVEGNDVCCCGDAIKNHSSPMNCGHSPVSVTDNFIINTIKERDSLKQQVEQLKAFIIKWLEFEESCIKKDGPYVSSPIPKLMNEANTLLCREKV